MDWNGQFNQVNVESPLRVLAWRTQLKQVKDGLDVGIETIVTLSSECNVAIVQRRDRLQGVFIQFSLRGNPVFGRILAIVALVVKRRGDALVVGRNDACAQDGGPAMPVIDLGHAVGLCQVLRGVADILDNPEVRLKDRARVFVIGLETKLVTQRGFALRHVIADGDMDLVEDVVVEIVLVRSDARFLVRVNAKSSHQDFRPVFLLHESVHIGRVRSRITGDQWRVHVARGEAGRGQPCRQHAGDATMEPAYSLFHRSLFLSFMLMVVDLVDSSARGQNQSPRLKRAGVTAAGLSAALSGALVLAAKAAS